MDNYILKTKGDVPNGAYKGNKEIVRVIVSKDTRIIGREAFEGCSNIESIEFEEGSSIESIEAWAFAACKKIKKIIFPDNEITLAAQAFIYCDSIEYLEFGNKNLSIHYDAFSTRNQIKEVRIPSEILDFNTGLNHMPSHISNHIDLCRLMLNCDRDTTFDSGLSLGTLLDMALKECVELGELNSNATVQEMYSVFSKYYYTVDQKEYVTIHSSNKPVERKWIVFPEDHFYTRMANAIFANWAFCEKRIRNNTIALLIDRDRKYSQDEYDKVNEYANIVGYKFEILRPIGRMSLGWDEENAPQQWDDVTGCEYESDDNISEVGVLYEDMISGKVYAMSSDYDICHEGLYMMMYSHFLEELNAIDPEDLYDANYKLRSSDIEFRKIEYLEIYKS